MLSRRIIVYSVGRVVGIFLKIAISLARDYNLPYHKAFAQNDPLENVFRDICGE